VNVRALGRHNSGKLGVAATLLVLPCLPVAARAAEQITLTNGFELVCSHHVVVEGRIRAYLKPADTDYVELKPEEIAGVEMVPDLPVVASAEGPVQSAIAKPAVAKAGARAELALETRLTAADLHQLLARAGSEHNVDEDLLASVVKMESGGYVRAKSRAGARGLMQLMPGTAQQMGVADSFVPEQNVRGGTAYLDSLLTRYHDNIALALAAYNAGPEAVDRYHGIPPYRETRVYVARVVHEFNRRVAAREKLGHQELAAINKGTR
jgi:hypothetical protein